MMCIAHQQNYEYQNICYIALLDHFGHVMSILAVESVIRHSYLLVDVPKYALWEVIPFGKLGTVFASSGTAGFKLFGRRNTDMGTFMDELFISKCL